MANSFVTYTGDGVTQNYNVTYPFITRSHVKAFLNLVETTAFTWLSDSQIRFNTAPANGVGILIKRETPQAPLVDFTAKSRWQTKDLNTAVRQAMYVAEEGIDNSSEWFSGIGAPSNAVGSEGDFYLNTLTGDVYRKGDVSWNSPIQNLTGPQGPQGPVGPQGPNGPGTGDMLKSQYDTNNDGKVNSAHTADSVPLAGVTGLQAALDGKAALAHTHIITNVTGLQTALDGKAALSHTHVPADVTGLGALATLGAVGSAQIVDGAATLAKLDRTGALGQVLVAQGVGNAAAWGEAPSGLTFATAVPASGASVEFTGIPAAANMVIAILSGVSSNGTNSVQIQIGPSGGVETTGYSGATSVNNSSAVASISTNGGFLFNFGASDTASASRHGVLVLVRITGNTWVAFGMAALGNANVTSKCSGAKTIAASINRLRFANDGANIFDAGTVNIGWMI